MLTAIKGAKLAEGAAEQTEPRGAEWRRVPDPLSAESTATAGVLRGQRWNSLTRAGLPDAKAPAEEWLLGQGPKPGER
jgi:hypothetical protein